MESYNAKLKSYLGEIKSYKGGMKSYNNILMKSYNYGKKSYNNTGWNHIIAPMVILIILKNINLYIFIKISI